jgi:hypothetical protein
MKASDIDFNKYKVYKDGRIWSEYKNGYLNGRKNKDGYMLVNLFSKDGKQHTYYLHRVVAELYCEIPSGHTIDELEVDHISTFKDDNRSCNLRWVTAKINHNNPATLVHRSECMRNKPSMSKIVQQFQDGELVAEFPSTREVERQLGFDHKAISKCCNGIRGTAYGYKWIYKKMV